MIFAFIAKADISQIKNSIAYRLHQRLEETGSFSALTKAEKEEFGTILNELWHFEAYKTGKYRLMGFVIDFTPWMKTFWVKYRYHGIHERFSFNKTTLRKWCNRPSEIVQIVEIKNNKVVEDCVEEELIC